MREAAMDAPFTMLKPLALLEKVAGMDHPATLAEIAEDSDVPKPTLHRWLGSLTNAGLLQRTPDGETFRARLPSHPARVCYLVKWTEWRTPSPDPSERCAGGRRVL